MKDYYVYIYFNPEKTGKFIYQDLNFDYEPIYIGKGKEYRADRHLVSCWNRNDKKKYRSIFYRKLRKLINKGIVPFYIIYKEHITEEESFSLEIDLISKIGRRIFKDGPLCNNSTGGEGVSGSKHSKFKIYVYNNEGKCIDIQESVKECSKNYKIPEMTIYKHCLKIRKLPKNGLRFRKQEENITFLPLEFRANKYKTNKK